MKKISPAKLNIFLKITGLRGAYHELNSRFVRYDKLFDIVGFIPKKQNIQFDLIGNFGCQTQSNTITKAYEILKQLDKKVEVFFKNHSVKVDKNIPEFSGLGGGSSNAASFLLLCNEVLNLGFSKEKLKSIGERVGADVPFFIYEYESANVSGIGEIVEKFDDDIPKIEISFPHVKSSTADVFSQFRKLDFYDKDYGFWKECSSKSLLESFDGKKLNDLFTPSMYLYEDLEKFYENGYFMSGSGSAMFRIKNG